jgi:oligoendopeptidase F
MNLKWDLTSLFENNEKFYDGIAKAKKLLSDIKKYSDTELDENSLLNMLDEKWNIKELANNILVYGSLMYYKNINSNECIKLKNDAESFNNEVNLELNFIDRKILDLGKIRVDEYIQKNPQLNTYKLSLDNLFRMQEHVQDDSINEEITKNINGINSQLNLYNNMLRDIKYGEIEIGGEKIEITSSNFAKYLSSRDRKTREKVYLTVNEQFENVKENFADILNTIFDYRNKNAKLEKYNSVLEKVLFEENIDSKIIDSLIKAVNNNLSLIQKYLKIKSDLLGIDDPHLYDFGVPLDNNLKIKYSFEEAVEIIKNALKPLGDEYLEVVDFLLNGHIDAEPNENKHQSITFSWNTYSFMNFRGAYVDLKNMIHELGHIVNYYLSKKNLPFIYEDSTIFVGETASIVNEILLNRYLYENAKTEEERIFYLSKEIENYFTSVFKQTMYTEFENDLYNLKLSKELSSEVLSERYGQLIRKYYGKNIVYDEQSNIEWTRLGHLFRWSYYPYKYATGLIIASVVVNSLLNENTLSKKQYIKFLSSGSSMYSLELLKMLNIDLTNPSIIENGFKVMENDVEKLNKVLSIKK